MALLDDLSPTQRQALMYGAPLVAAVGLGVAFARRDAPEAPAEADDPAAGVGAIGPFVAPTTDAIGVGQLSEFESSITDVLLDLTQAVQDLEDQASPTPTPTPGAQSLRQLGVPALINAGLRAAGDQPGGPGPFALADVNAEMWRRRISVNRADLTGTRLLTSYVAYALAHGARPAGH